jgi:nitroimidazol reductase NimA-like FMN-containing flavoprotein (pyridoxamine 5'-phosphate oxidase superfamily)
MPERGRYDRNSIDAVLDRGLVAHVAFVDGETPVCIPTLYARVEDHLLVHGSTASRALRTLGSGVAACVTVTIVDGLILARSVFEHSANYDSVVAFGRFERVEEEAGRLAAFAAFTNRLLPGRWDEARQPNAKELKATTILRMPLDEVSLKSRTGPPSDDDTPDAELDVWAGIVPILTSFGEPLDSPGLKDGVPLPESVRRVLGS